MNPFMRLLQNPFGPAGEQKVIVSLTKVRLNRGGYDSRGRYWGVGQPLYQYDVGDTRGGFIMNDYIRAIDRAHAKDLIRRRLGSRYDVRFMR